MLDLGLDDHVSTGRPPLLVAETADAARPASVTMPMVQLTPEQQEEYRRMSEDATKPDPDPITISVYIDDGMVFEYDIPAGNRWQAREHVSAIIATGYRSVRDEVLTHYPPHRISKVKATGQNTAYPDRVRGT
jgi:hypothetical protein